MKADTLRSSNEPVLTLAVDSRGEPEVFHSLQGEGPEIGRPSVFVRLSGCNLQCFWCDTPYTWNWLNTTFAHASGKKYDRAKEQAVLTVADLARRLARFPCRHLVLTGGEPLAQQSRLPGLIAALRNDDPAWTVDLETNGTIVPGEAMDSGVALYVVSPKLSGSGLEEAERLRPEALAWFAACDRARFKFVIASRQEADELAALAAQYRISNDHIYVMPQATGVEELDRAQRACAEWSLEYGWRCSDRLHLRLFGAGRGV